MLPFALLQPNPISTLPPCINALPLYYFFQFSPHLKPYADSQADDFILCDKHVSDYQDQLNEAQDSAGGGAGSSRKLGSTMVRCLAQTGFTTAAAGEGMGLAFIL